MGRKEMEKESHSEFVKAARPGGPPAKRQPSPEGLGTNPQDDLSAVGATPNLGPHAPVSFRPLRRRRARLQPCRINVS